MFLRNHNWRFFNININDTFEEASKIKGYFLNYQIMIKVMNVCNLPIYYYCNIFKT